MSVMGDPRAAATTPRTGDAGAMSGRVALVTGGTGAPVNPVAVK